MITAFRRYLGTWVVRGFFLIMVLSFISWGVGDVIRLVGTSTWAAKVGGQTIEGVQLQEAYQREMARVTRNLPAGQEPTQDMRSGVAREALQQLITQAALNQELQRLHVVTPDQVVRQTVFTMPVFRGPNGMFDRQTFETLLRNNGLTEARFLDMTRGDLAQRQLLGAVSAGTATPEVLLRPLYQSQFEKRSADMVEFPLAAAPEPTAPTEAELQRWYDNHPDQYSAPEYRRIKAVVLSPQTLAKDIPISDADLQSAYEQRKAQYVKPATTLGRSDLGGGRGKGQGARRTLAGRRRLGGDAEGRAGRRRFGDRAGRCVRARIPRCGPGACRVRRHRTP